jgi:hypothetical protein
MKVRVKPSELPIVVNRGDAPRMSIYGIVDQINRTLDDVVDGADTGVVALDRDLLRLVVLELRNHQQRYCTGCAEALAALPADLVAEV